MKTAANFDLARYLLKIERKYPGWRNHPETRRLATRRDPLLFALLYLPHHLRGEETGDKITFGDAHLYWAEDAKRWMHPVRKPSRGRTATIAPRSMGKSTWYFLLRPLWGAAHGWVKFAAAFADSGDQAKTHLRTFRDELATNDLLREDYPELCEPKKNARNVIVADNDSLFIARSGFAFGARGIDSGALGMKIGKQRPDLLILDDIEPGESGYSLFQMEKRLSTLQDVVLPLNVFAFVDIVGTVTMPGSIIHQLVKAARGIETAPWISEERIKATYFPAVIVGRNGKERSIWPAKWSLKFLRSIAHTRAYAKNYQNDPIGADGDYWTSEDFVHGNVGGVTSRVLFIDPAVTEKKSSDFTGLAVVGISPSARKILVELARAVKLSPSSLRRHVLTILEEFRDSGRPIRGIVIEANQGGDTWKSILHDMPVAVVTFSSSMKKEVRAAEILNDYQLGLVVHVEGLTALEEQMVAFPKAPNDDLVDAVGSGVAFFLHRRRKRRKKGATSTSYL